MSLEVTIGNIEFQNPLVLASGTFGYGLTYTGVVNNVGALVTKGITVKPKPGNPPPRIWDSAETVINSVGLENVGLEAFATDVLPKINVACPVFVNLAGVTIDDFSKMIDVLGDDDRVAGFELNLSCPNVKEGGTALGQKPESVAEVTGFVKKRTDKQVWVKLTANFCDVRNTSRAAAHKGADAVVLVNTFNALVVDVNGSKPFLGAGSGGLSGPAIKPHVAFIVNKVSKMIDVPVIASGGVVSGKDVVEYLLAGASLVQLGSVNLVDPEASVRILSELDDWFQRKNVTSPHQIIGKLED